MLSAKLLKILRDWWCLDRPKQWLFPSDVAGSHVGRRTVEKACKTAHRRCRNLKPITPHSLRHYLPSQTMSRNGELLLISPEIPDRLVQSASKSRDIVLCLLQALPEARSRSLNRVQVSSMVTGSLQTARSVMARGRCGARYGSTCLAIIYFAVDSFALQWG